MSCPTTVTQGISVQAPAARAVSVCWDGASSALTMVDGRWQGSFDAPIGTEYWLSVDGGPPLVDPDSAQIRWTAAGPRSVVAAPWPAGERLGVIARYPVIYELHVRGFGRTYRGVAERLDHLVALGVDVIELMPIHPFDTTDNYWGYMPVVWGAVHDGYAEGADPAAELALLVAEAHRRGIAVWLDVVVNHTGEGAADMPTWTLRGLDDAGSYLMQDGRYVNASGTGNTVNPASPEIRRLIRSALQRFADLGIDGFRFDLAAILALDGGSLIAEIAAWADQQGISVVAEPWDLGAYRLGSPVWVAPWQQWNDRFRDDVRAMLRGDAGTVQALSKRVTGSVDLFGADAVRSTINFVTAHDGLTMHDLTLVADDHHRAWQAPEELRPQLLKNYFTVLLLSAGAAMFVQGDEFARTQLGHPNPYNVDGPVSWVDWSRLDQWSDLHGYVTELIRMRKAHPMVDARLHGVGPEPDLGHDSHSLAWTNGELYVMVNAWTEPLEFGIHAPGTWELAMSSAPMHGRTVPPLATAVWRRTGEPALG